MFRRRRWLHRGRIDSDEGFYIALGRDLLVYGEGNRRMSVTIDFGADQVNVFQISIGRWDDNPQVAIGNAERLRIADNIKRAIESQGLTFNLM
jgi:hypothetical protein